MRSQPTNTGGLAAALRALVACPVGAIGDAAHRPLRDAATAFPLPIDGPVSYLGFNARASYGANSYLLERAGGNWMIDAPRWNAGLAGALEARGGVTTIFLTHRDAPVAFDECTVIPTPGHTRGHCVLHAGDYLFSGDHLAWDGAAGRLDAHRNVCWYDWPAQIRSVARLRDVPFRWLLPGHGERVRLERPAMAAAIDALVARS